MMLKDAQCLFMTFENSNDNSLHFLKPEFGCQNEKTAGRKEKKKEKKSYFYSWLTSPNSINIAHFYVGEYKLQTA